jgi:hypothetical protein
MSKAYDRDLESQISRMGNSTTGTGTERDSSGKGKREQVGNPSIAIGNIKMGGTI